MTQLATSLRFVDLPPVIQLVATFASTGRLKVGHDYWTGTILFRKGQLVAASLGTESGLTALDGIVIGLLEGDISYVDERISDDRDVLLSADRRPTYLAELSAERQRVRNAILSLGLVPRLVDGTNTQVTVAASTLHLIPILVSGRTLDQIAREHGLARILRGATRLLEDGVITLEPAPHAEPTQEPAPPPEPTRTPTRAYPAARSAPSRPLGRSRFVGVAERSVARLPRVEQSARVRPAAVRRAPEPAMETQTAERRGSGLVAGFARFFGFEEPQNDAIVTTSTEHPTSAVLVAVQRFFGFDETVDQPGPGLDASPHAS